MEEDIKILEGLVKGIYKYGFDYDVDGEKHDIIRYEEFKAIENLIKGYRELEEREIWSTATINGLKRDFIPKSKIKEKIEEDAFEVFTSEYGNIEVVCTDSLYELMEDK
jgi:hypothetical protein